MGRNRTAFAWSLLSVGGTFVIWELLVRLRVIDGILIPAPTAILAVAARLYRSGELPAAAGATLARMATGFSIGAAAGVLIGLLMGVSETFRRLVSPMIAILNSAPKLTLLPMLMLFLGIGEAPRITVIALTTLVILAMQSFDAVRAVQPSYIEIARNNGAGRAALFRDVYFPAALPGLFTGLRIAAGRAMVMTVSVELIGARKGLGNLIWMGWQTFAVEKLFTGVIVTMLLGAALHWGAVQLESWFVPWRREQLALPD